MFFKYEIGEKVVNCQETADNTKSAVIIERIDTGRIPMYTVDYGDKDTPMSVSEAYLVTESAVLEYGSAILGEIS